MGVASRGLPGVGTPLSYLHHSPRTAPALDVINVRTSDEVHEAFLLWRKRASAGSAGREVRCSIDHIGEGLFELHLESGHALLLNEPFCDTEALLARAEELQKDTGKLPA